MQRGRFGFGDGWVGDGILAAHLFARPLQVETNSANKESRDRATPPWDAPR